MLYKYPFHELASQWEASIHRVCVDVGLKTNYGS
jgi:hypothetical protein